MDATAEDLGDRVVAARRARGWSQAELAKQAGVAENTVSKIERGTGDTQPAKLRQVLDALGIAPVTEVLAAQGGYPDDIELVRDMIGLWLRNIPPDERAEEVLRLTAFLYDQRVIRKSNPFARSARIDGARRDGSGVGAGLSFD